VKKLIQEKKINNCKIVGLTGDPDLENRIEAQLSMDDISK
jgi:hypothetical protein